MSEALANILVFALLMLVMGTIFMIHLVSMKRLKLADARRQAEDGSSHAPAE